MIAYCSHALGMTHVTLQSLAPLRFRSRSQMISFAVIIAGVITGAHVRGSSDFEGMQRRHRGCSHHAGLPGICLCLTSAPCLPTCPVHLGLSITVEESIPQTACMRSPVTDAGVIIGGQAGDQQILNACRRG